MSRWIKIAGMVAVAAMVLVATTGVVLAEDDTYIYGLVFIDTNMNGVWDVGEQGYTGEWQTYWEDDEYIQKYVGATITFNAGDPDTEITLTSAVPTDFTGALSENGQDLCTYQDYTVDDEVNTTPARPCSGSYGLRPAGDNGTTWLVTITPPEGYVVTSANPQYVTVNSDGISPVDFGIVPTGAGGATTTTATVEPTVYDTSTTLLPQTGAGLPGIAAVAILIGAGGIAVGTKKLRE